MQSIYNYIKISSLLLCLGVFTVQAQKKTIEKPKETTPKVKFFNGLTVQVDAASLLTTALIHGDSYSMEGGVQFNLMKKYYPIIELGFAGANKISNDNVGFKTNAPFGRIGLDINLLKPKKDAKPTNNLFLAGVRLGMSSFGFDVTNLTLTDEYWSGSQILNYNNQKSTKIWYEIVVGMKVEVIKNVYMGWNVRSKGLFKEDTAGNVFPWYIPGYGINTSSNWTANYIIGYQF